MKRLEIPICLGTVKPAVTRELDWMSTPETDEEAQYVMLLWTDESPTSKMFFDCLWGLYWCHRHQGLSVLDAWIAALEVVRKKSMKFNKYVGGLHPGNELGDLERVIRGNMRNKEARLEFEGPPNNFSLICHPEVAEMVRRRPEIHWFRCESVEA